MQGPMSSLKIANDIITVPVFAPSELATLRLDFKYACESFREFKDGAFPGLLQLGSFGAFSNPSSFHNYFARFMRKTVHRYAKPLIGQQGKYFTQLFDRMAIRTAGTEYKGESWHRDSHPMAGEIWGGWVNLDDQHQHFHCVPNSAIKTGEGFGREPEPPLHAQATISVPPGNMILFRQDILHCILKSCKDYDSYRFYVGFRISDEPDAIYDALEVINDQSVPYLPSGEFPAMFSRNHDSALLYSHTIPWSELFVQDFIKEPRHLGDTEMFLCPRQITRGLTFYEMPYERYAPDEIKIMMPQLL